MDALQSQLKELKDKFRTLLAKERENLSIALLKVNLGVNTPDELSAVEKFTDGLPIEFKVGKLDAFMNYLYASPATAPPDLSLSAKDSKDKTDSQVNIGLPAYREDEVDTIKNEVHPFAKTHKSIKTAP